MNNYTVVNKLKISTMKVSDVQVEDPFATLFPVSRDTVEAIKIDMASNGYDQAFPVIIWEEKNIIVDGHTRFTAATEIELAEVPVIMRSFMNEDDAILYAFHLQRNRRNLADEDILRCLQVLDNIKVPGRGAGKDDGPNLTKKETAELRAKEIGTSKSKIDKARTVLEHGSDDIKESVNSGDKSINSAFKEVQEIRRESGELKGPRTTGLACGSRYNKAFGKFLEELNRVKEDGWQQVTVERALLDLETIRSTIED